MFWKKNYRIVCIPFSKHFTSRTNSIDLNPTLGFKEKIKEFSVNTLLDPKSLSSLSNEDLQRWYSTVDDLCKRESVLNDLQYSIRIELQEELQATGDLLLIQLIADLKNLV
jgi:hypothetical protein